MPPANAFSCPSLEQLSHYAAESFENFEFELLNDHLDFSVVIEPDENMSDHLFMQIGARHSGFNI